MTLLTAVVAVALTCDATLFFNHTKFKFNKHDEKIYKLNSKKCGRGRYVDTPCVKYFAKVGERDYHLVCSTVEDSKWGK